MKERYRILVVMTHPVQYASPILRLLARHERLELSVAYCSLQGAEPGVDPEFGVPVQWDVPLLDGYKWRALPDRSPSPGPGRFFGLVNPAIWGLIRRGGFDVVAFLTGYNCMTFWIGLLAAKTAGIPVMMGTDAVEMTSAWGGWWWKRWLKPPLVRAIYRSADVVTAPSSATRDFLRSIGVSEGRIVLNHYTVDNEFFATHAASASRDQIRRSLGIPEDAIVTLYCAKLVAWKRPMDLLRAFARATSAGSSSAFLLLAGDGAERRALEQAAQELGISDRTRFLGFVNQSRLPGIYAASDFLVLPSQHEPWGLVVNEAMACGLPAVVSDRVGAHRDLIVSGANGWVFPMGDIESLASILRALVCDPARIRQMGRAARERVKNWSYSENVAGFLRAVEKAIAAKSRHLE